jgi:competence protein ComEA
MNRLSAFIFAALLLISAPFVVAAEKTSVSPADAAIQQAININTADVDTLTQLKGVGVKKAEAIVAWRESNGPFTSVEQLTEVKGIGDAILDANRAQILLK